MELVACKQHKFKIGGLRSSLVAYGQVWWSTVKFGSSDMLEAEVVMLG